VDYVTAADLVGVVGAGAPGDRVARAVAAANYLVERWTPTDPLVIVLPPDPPAPPTPAQAQAGLELAVHLYRRQAAPGGLTETADLVAQLPADLVRGVRDLLDVDTSSWGIA
jgi:3-hydroxyacyl-CoA dehydrogenase